MRLEEEKIQHVVALLRFPPVPRALASRPLGHLRAVLIPVRVCKNFCSIIPQPFLPACKLLTKLSPACHSLSVVMSVVDSYGRTTTSGIYPSGVGVE